MGTLKPSHEKLKSSQSWSGTVCTHNDASNLLDLIGHQGQLLFRLLKNYSTTVCQPEMIQKSEQWKAVCFIIFSMVKTMEIYDPLVQNTNNNKTTPQQIVDHEAMIM